MNLFEKKKWTMHSGDTSDFKIECDALTSDDWDTIAYLIAKHFSFSNVVGIPRGGIALERSLKKYKKSLGPLLIVDDVLTTGTSMEEMKDTYLERYNNNIIGVVVFARGKCPNWITPIFSMNGLIN
jgi:hypoxanthine phosphoribosyltransferase